MTCRKIIHNEGQPDTVVWFGSAGLGLGQKKIPAGDNYDTKLEAIRDSIVQRLSVIQNELWFDFRFGLPLFEPRRLKMLFDSKIAEEVLDVEGVTAIIELNSDVAGGTYTCTIQVQTVYGITSVEY